MRALSVKQPFAELIARGTKQIEYRSRFIRFRGPLLIVASASRNDFACFEENVDPNAVPYGATVCVIDVVDVTGSREDGYEWHLRNPRRVEPIPTRGYAAIYSFPESDLRFTNPDDADEVKAAIARYASVTLTNAGDEDDIDEDEDDEVAEAEEAAESSSRGGPRSRPSPRRRRLLLGALPRQRLADLSEYFDLQVTDRRSSDAHVDALIRRRSLAFEAILERLRNEELSILCSNFEVEKVGRDKISLVQSLVSWATPADGGQTNGGAEEPITSRASKPPRGPSMRRVLQENATLEQKLAAIKEWTDPELRDQKIDIGAEGPDPGPPYPHQLEAIRRVELGTELGPPLSGILHYPTGAGKTRVGLEIAARALHANPKHRFIWATHTKNLIRQSMLRMGELSRLFPAATWFSWARDAENAEIPEDDVHVQFMTRATLTDALERASDRRRSHPWRLHLEAGNPLTLIYDECHQLGAQRLQESMRRFYEAAVLTNGAGTARPWRVIGLSATPVPTQQSSHDLLAEHVFPVRAGAPAVETEWPFHVVHRVRNETLVESGVLCPINLFFDQEGTFDLPKELLNEVLGEAHLTPPGPGADKRLVQLYAKQFNSVVMGDARVIDFLVQKLGEHIEMLGKTIVFVPNIVAANRLGALLYERFPNLRGKVAAVHSKIEDLTIPGQESASVHEVLERFRAHGSTPSILVNVDMLTEGFDDPSIQSVVLARLTLSTNRFWQMIGRGTRGPAAQGTTSCNVIDPVKLTRLYEYFRGYQPGFGPDREKEFEDLDDGGNGQDGVPPQMPAVLLPPEANPRSHEVSPELERVHAQLAQALRHFLDGHSLTEKQVIEAARSVDVTMQHGKATLQPSDGAFDPVTASMLLLGEIAHTERRAQTELGWFRRQLPTSLDEGLLRHRMRLLRAVESLRLWTDADFAAAQLDGRLFTALKTEAGSGPEETSPSTTNTDIPPWSEREEAVLDAAMAMAAADGKVVDAEIVVVLETLRRMFGRAPNAALEATVRARPLPDGLPFEHVSRALRVPEQQQLLLHLAEVAAADGVIAPEERALLHSFATRMAVPPAYADAILNAHLRAEPSARTCSACGTRVPQEAAYCQTCGQRLASASDQGTAVA